MLTKKNLSKQGLANIRAGVAKRMAKKRADELTFSREKRHRKDKPPLKIKGEIFDVKPSELKKVKLFDPEKRMEPMTVVISDDSDEGVLIDIDGSFEWVKIVNLSAGRL